ncbi:MAG: lysylphosphatidylglycerol synthase transmembrane domain-containing protein [Candidatus Omnitrophota bacterium]
MQILKKILSVLLRIGISAALLIFLFQKVDRKSLLEVIKGADKPLLLFSFLIFCLTYIFGLLRWEMLLKAVNIRLPFRRIIISYSGGIFFSLFLPSTIGGDFMRTVDLAAHTKKPGEVMATVLLDRLSGYIGLAILALGSLIFGLKIIADKSVLLSLAVIIIVLVSVLLVLFNKFLYSKINKLLDSPDAGRIRELLRNMHREVHLFKHKKKIILRNLALSFVIQLIAPMSFYLTASALGLKVNIAYFLIFLPIIGAITLLPISIGGLGLRDATTIFFFAKAGVAKDLAFAMSLINFSFILIGGIIGGSIYVFTVRHRRLQYHPSSAV